MNLLSQLLRRVPRPRHQRGRLSLLPTLTLMLNFEVRMEQTSGCQANDGAAEAAHCRCGVPGASMSADGASMHVATSSFQLVEYRKVAIKYDLARLLWADIADFQSNFQQERIALKM